MTLLWHLPSLPKTLHPVQAFKTFAFWANTRQKSTFLPFHFLPFLPLLLLPHGNCTGRGKAKDRHGQRQTCLGSWCVIPGLICILVLCYFPGGGEIFSTKRCHPILVPSQTERAGWSVVVVVSVVITVLGRSQSVTPFFPVLPSPHRHYAYV